MLFAGAKMKFKNHHRKMKVPFVIYGDFECLIETISSPDVNDDDFDDDVQPPPPPEDDDDNDEGFPPQQQQQQRSIKVTNTQKHIPCSFAYHMICDSDKNLNKTVIY